MSPQAASRETGHESAGQTENHGGELTPVREEEEEEEISTS